MKLNRTYPKTGNSSDRKRQAERSPYKMGAAADSCRAAAPAASRFEIGSSRSCHGLRRRREKAMALVVSLTLILLVTIAVLAFFSFATANRRVESSRANRVKAELLAETGAAHVVEQLMAQISDSDRSAIDTRDEVTIYTPKSRADALPERRLAESINPANEKFLNLIGQSVPGADEQASDHSTTVSARNGRILNATRWNAPALLTENGFDGEAQLPHWIYVDRMQGLSAAPTADTIGRIAYNLYDIGGLLNANAVGYPEGLDADATAYLSRGQEGADLTRLPSIQTNDRNALASFRHPDEPTGTEFAARTAGAAANGFLFAFNQNLDSEEPFTQNMFNTRQDLIRYARVANQNFQDALPFLTHFSRSLNAPSWIPPVSNASDTFTYGNAEIQSVRYPQSGTVTHFDDDGDPAEYEVAAGEPLVQRRFSLAKLAWLAPSGPAAGIASEAIQSAFGLKWNDDAERWDYVGPSGDDTLSTIQTLAEIATEPQPREPNFFEYLKAGILTGGLGSHANPDSGNSNVTVLTAFDSEEDPYPYDANRDLHILKIGMNILDCADPDNFPSVAALEFEGTAVERAGIEDLPYFYNVQMMNLRQLDWNMGSEANPVILEEDDPETEQDESRVVTNGREKYRTNQTRWRYHYLWSHIFWAPELLNPHQISTPTAGGPESLRVRISEGVLIKVAYFENALRNSQPIDEPDLAARTPLVVSADRFSDFRAAPSPIFDSTSASRLGAMEPRLEGPGFPNADPPFPYETVRNELAFHIHTFEPNDECTPSHFAQSDAPSKMPVVELENLMIRLEYRTPDGGWKTYATLGGEEAFPEDTGIVGVYDDASDDQRGRFRVFKQSKSLNEYANNPNLYNFDRLLGVNLQTWDPRTSRFGPVFLKYDRTLGQLPPFKKEPKVRVDGVSVKNSTGKILTDNFATTNSPFFPEQYFWHKFQSPYGPKEDRRGFVGNFPQYPGFEDPDIDDLGPRPPDANIGFEFELTSGESEQVSTPANPYGPNGSQQMTDMSRRPVILQRPYRNVAELGYVFRDVPWQTLNFHNDRTADAALLDLFAVNDEPAVTASRVGLGRVRPQVLKALLGGAVQDAAGTTTLSDDEIDRVANAFGSFDFQTDSYNYPSGDDSQAKELPLNVAFLPSFLGAISEITGMEDEAVLSPIKWQRETVTRALAASQTRTWNVLADVVAQSGRFPPGMATSAENFQVEGESRIWASISIDRYTGGQVGRQMEKVNE